VGHRQPARRGVLDRRGGRQDQPAVLHPGRKTERIWYYDLSGVKVGKKTR
jgi:hypothetical protein